MKIDLIQNDVIRVAEKFKHRIAVQYQNRDLTYADLYDVAAKTARDLLAFGGKNRAITGIYLDASIEYVVAVLGTLMAGRVFFPLNIKFPDQRLSETLRLTEPDVIITREALETELRARLLKTSESVKPPSIYVIPDDVLNPQHTRFQASAGGAAPKNDVGSSPSVEEDSDACYLIATSGSIGEPKVILGSHAGLCHFIRWEINEFNLDETVRASFLSHPTFDDSLRDIFVPLCCGGTLVIPDETTKQDPAALYRWFEDRRIRCGRPASLEDPYCGLDRVGGKR